MTRASLTSIRPLRLTCACLAALAFAATGAPASHAADLLILDTEEVTLSGAQNFGFVYVDGDLRLTGDTTITAASIYLGPNAALRTCFVEGTGNNGCAAGRSLTLRSTGPLTLSPGIDLRAGTGAVRNAGSLRVEGASVAIGGDVDVTGSGGGTSGTVSISSGGPLSVGAIYAYGAPVALSAGGAIDVGGDIQAQGTSGIALADPARVQRGGSLSIGSTGGDVRVNGNLITYGRDAPGAGGTGLGGGTGGDIAVAGTDVRVGTVDGTGGSSVDGPAGQSGRIALDARGSLHVLGRLEGGGQNSSASAATGGARIAAIAGGPLVAAGGAYSGGGQGSTGGMPGGEIVLQGASVATGTLWAGGANAPNSGTPGNGGAGGSISVSSAGATSLGTLQAYGGNAAANMTPGRGGPIAVTSAGGSISTGWIQTYGGWPPNGPGADGGPVSLSAAVNLTVGDSLNASGSNASGDAAPPRRGGDGGNLVLRAGTGTLSLGGMVRTTGGYGAAHPDDGNLGGPGGNGGQVDLVAAALGPIVGISTHAGGGGDWGDDRGPGGAGGAVTGWTDAPLFDDQKVVDTDGGDGNPVGPSGLKVAQLSPVSPAIDPATNLLAFTARSPGAKGYRVLRSIGGGAPEVVVDTTATTAINVPAPVCVPVSLTVVAHNADVGWASPASPGVPYTRQPSATQQCDDAPGLTATKRLRFKRRSLRRAKWRMTLPLRADGIGTVQGTLTRTVRGRKSARTVARMKAVPIARPGTQKLRLALPRAARRTGRYALRLVTTAPDGKARRTITLKLEVK